MIRFDAALDHFEVLFFRESFFAWGGTICGITLLVRMIVATSTHPRVAVLVNTVGKPSRAS